jgi:heptosyltransferase-2
MVSRGKKKYLVVGPAWIGDMVMAQSLFKTIRQRDPGSVIDVLAPAWSEPLLARMPEVGRAITVPLGHGELGITARYRIGRKLRAEQYDQAIILPRSLKSALIPFFAGIKQRTGYCGELRYGLLNDIRPLDKGVLKKVVQRYVALGMEVDEALSPAELPYPSLLVDEVSGQTIIGRLGLNTEKPVAAFMPGAEYGPAKQWPIEHFAKLARRLTAAGYKVWQFGSDKELAVASQIDELAGNCTTVLCGKTSLQEAIDLIAQVDVVVTNDSGLMHVAAALDKPMIAIYGSSTPDYTPPLNDRAEMLYLGLDCSPCFERVCRFGHTRCLVDITPESVFQHLQSIVTRKEMA